MDKIIGREQEKTTLSRCITSDKAELIAVYGRRRIGKTFLVKNFFENRFDFYTTGIYKGTRKEQLRFFNKQLCNYSGMPYPLVDNWFDAFDQLKHYLAQKKETAVVFLDEMPWMDSPRSSFLKAFEVFWNGWASDHANIKIIVCGSATTWMISNLFGNKGGLYNRVTCRIKLQPFSLGECEMYFKAKGIVWNRKQIIEAYMIFGGIPFYLEMIRKGQSLSQAVDSLFFSESGELRNEYDFLFRSLFNESAAYRGVVESLSKKSKGMTRQEIQAAMKISDGGRLTEVLDNLCNCDFIRRYNTYGHTERNMVYQLTDLFTLFHFKFVKGKNTQDNNFWSLQTDTPQHNTWSGYAFEQVCLHHLPQIKKALGINGIRSDVCAWSCRKTEEHAGAQIDLVIDRKDQVVNLCEMKFSNDKYSVTADYEKTLRNKITAFRTETRTRSALHLTMITTYGIVENSHSDIVVSEVTADELFE